MWVVRADVAGRTAVLASGGSSAIVDPHGRLVSRSANELNEDSPIVEIYVTFTRWRPTSCPCGAALKGCATSESRARGRPAGLKHVYTPLVIEMEAQFPFELFFRTARRDRVESPAPTEFFAV